MTFTPTIQNKVSVGNSTTATTSSFTGTIENVIPYSSITIIYQSNAVATLGSGVSYNFYSTQAGGASLLETTTRTFLPILKLSRYKGNILIYLLTMVHQPRWTFRLSIIVIIPIQIQLRLSPILASRHLIAFALPNPILYLIFLKLIIVLILIVA